MTSEEFIQRLRDLILINETDRLLARLCMRFTDEALSAGEYTKVDKVFQKIDVSILPAPAVIGLLIFTRFEPEKMPARTDFVAKVLARNFAAEDMEEIKAFIDP